MKKILILLLLFFSVASAQNTLVRRAELGDSTNAVRVDIGDSLNSRFGGWDTTKIKSVVGDTSAVLRALINSADADNFFSTPEQYSGTDAQKIDSAITERGTKIVLLRNTYNIASQVVVDGDSSDLRIIALPTARIISTTSATTDNDYDELSGHIWLQDFGMVDIDGLTLEVQSGYGTLATNDNGLLIDSADVIYLKNVKIMNSDYNGIMIAHANRVYMQSCKADSNLYGGLFVTEISGQLDVFNSDFSNNGVIDGGYNYGYGIALGRKWGSDTTGGLYNVNINGNKFYHNMRTAVSGHGGRHLHISNNNVYGFGSSAFTPINESGTETEESYVEFVQINNNIVRNDPTWIVAQSLDGYANRPIWAGQYYDTGINNPLYHAIGSIEITNNIIADVNVSSLYAPIIINTNRKWEQRTGQSTIKSVKVFGNTISECDEPAYTSGIIVTGTDSLYRDNPENIDISGNTIEGSGVLNLYGIIVSDGKNVNIANNNVVGFDYPVLGSVPYTGYLNKLDSVYTASVGNQRNYSDYTKYSGSARFALVTTQDPSSSDSSHVAVSLGRVNLEPSENGYGGSVIQVDIFAATYNPDYVSKFSGIASAGYYTDTTSGIICLGDTLAIDLQGFRTGNTSGIARPRLSWMSTDYPATERKYYLYAVLEQPYTNWFIDIKWSGQTPFFVDDTVAVDTSGGYALIYTDQIENQTRWRDHTYDRVFSGNLDMNNYDINNIDTANANVGNIDSVYSSLVKTDSAHITGTASIDSLKIGTRIDIDADNYWYGGIIHSLNGYILGSDISLLPIAGDQSAITTWWALQLLGNRQATVNYSPSSVGISSSAYHVVIPMVQTASAGLAILGVNSQTGNYFEATSNANKTTTHGDIFNISSSGNVGIGTTSPTSKLTVEGGVSADSVASGYFNGRDSSYFFKWDPFIPISSPESDSYLIDMWTTKGIHIDSICVATFDSTIHGVRFWWGTALNSMPNAIIADSAREILGDGVMNVTGTWFSGDDLSNKDIPVNSFIQVVTTGTAGVHQEKLFIKIRGWWY